MVIVISIITIPISNIIVDVQLLYTPRTSLSAPYWHRVLKRASRCTLKIQIQIQMHPQIHTLINFQINFKQMYTLFSTSIAWWQGLFVILLVLMVLALGTILFGEFSCCWWLSLNWYNTFRWILLQQRWCWWCSPSWYVPQTTIKSYATDINSSNSSAPASPLFLDQTQNGPLLPILIWDSNHIK